MKQEALREQLIGFRDERLRRQGELLTRVEAELEKRSLADLSTARLFTMAESIRRQILKETTSKYPPAPTPEEALGSDAEPAISVAPQNRCKNGAISVQPSTDSIPSPPLEEQGQGEEVPNNKPRSAPEPNFAINSSPTQVNNKQSTTQSASEVQPLFKHRVLIEDLGRELRLHYARAK